MAAINQGAIVIICPDCKSRDVEATDSDRSGDELYECQACEYVWWSEECNANERSLDLDELPAMISRR